MKKFLLASAVFCACTAPLAWAQAPAQQAPASPTAKAPVLCDSCGIVQKVHEEKRKGKGSGVGVVGGAVVGGLVGNQFGGGTGKTLATIGGAVAGGYAGNEVEKNVKSTTVWVTTVKMKNGQIRTFEQQAQPHWSAGSTVKVQGHTLSPI